MPTIRAISRMDFPCADISCMVLMVPLLIMATSLVSKINTSVALLKGWVNSFLAFMGQLYLGFYIAAGRIKELVKTVTDLQYLATKAYVRQSAQSVEADLSRAEEHSKNSK